MFSLECIFQKESLRSALQCGHSLIVTNLRIELGILESRLQLSGHWPAKMSKLEELIYRQKISARKVSIHRLTPRLKSVQNSESNNEALIDGMDFVHLTNQVLREFTMRRCQKTRF